MSAAREQDVHVGDEGWLFLAGGEQQVIDLYRSESAFTDAMARGWVELLRQRRDTLQARGIRYVHMPAPDKLTLLHRHFGGDGLENPGGSPLMQISARYDWDTPSMLNVVPYLSGQIDRYPVYWKSDTHWSCWGCFLAYQLLCSHLQIPVNQALLNYPFEESEQVMDLGRLIKASPVELARTYRMNRLSRRVYASPLVRYLEANGLQDDPSMQSGTHVIYQNDSPDAADKVVLLFGDSSSDHRNHLLTGMLAETVRELHFIWSDRLDDEYIRRVRPDIVITEQAERTMMRLPVDDLDVVLAGRERVAKLVATPRASDATKRESVHPSVEVERRLVLPGERYPLVPPVTVQSGCDVEKVEPEAITFPGVVLRTDGARIYFNGTRCLVSTADGQDLRRYEVDEARAARVADEQYRPLRGTTLLLADTPGAHCYYHWILDILPKFALLEKAGVSLDSIDHFVVRELTGAFQRETLQRFGIGDDRIVQSLDNQYLAPESLLHVPLDNGTNLRMHRRIPAWLKHAFPHERSDEPRLRLYISRPEGVRRGVANEAALRPALERHGFQIRAMEGLTMQQQVQLMSQVDVLVSPHGGALTNMVFCRQGTRVLELLGRHVYPYYFGLAAACGHEYHAVLQRPVEDYARLVNLAASNQFAAADIQSTTAEEHFDVDPEAFDEALGRL